MREGGKEEEEDRKSAEEEEGEQEDKVHVGRGSKMRTGGGGGGGEGRGFRLSYILLIDKSVCIFVYHLASGRGGGGGLEILFGVARWYVSIHWASIPLVKLMVVSTSLTLCSAHGERGGWGVGGGENCFSSGQLTNPLVFTKFRCEHPLQITPPQGRAQNYLPCSKI